LIWGVGRERGRRKGRERWIYGGWERVREGGRKLSKKVGTEGEV
jgi:hypothetical protein